VTQMTAVSLFAGIGGLDHAFARTGVRVAAAVEIDVAARGVIHDRMPNTALFTDVRKVTADELRAAGFDPDNGVLLAGWPCQDLSMAGRRLGLGGARSGLFWEIIRLLADLRPRWFCLENVPGLLVGGLPLPRRSRTNLRRPLRHRAPCSGRSLRIHPHRRRSLHGTPRRRNGCRPRGAG
jgi:site-specific DNA-cytosine methylase